MSFVVNSSDEAFLEAGRELAAGGRSSGLPPPEPAADMPRGREMASQKKKSGSVMAENLKTFAVSAVCT
jgi:hypothetical protein